MTKWRLLTCWAVVLGLGSPAMGTTFSASLKDIVGQVPKARVEIKLVGCDGYIATSSGDVVAPFYASRYADGLGNISLSVADQASYSCANGDGPIYYHVSIFYTDSHGKEQVGPDGDYDVTGSTFNLNSATPRAGVFEWLLANFRGIPLDTSVGTPADGQALIYDAGLGKYKAGSPTAVSVDAFCSDAGSTDAYACNLSPSIVSYTTGSHYRFKANTVNTGAATINFNAIGAKAIKKFSGGSTVDLADGDIQAGQWIDLIYDGTNMQSLLGNGGYGN